MSDAEKDYWEQLAEAYQAETTISVEDFHFGPLLPGNRELGLVPRAVKGWRCLELGCGGAQNSIVLAQSGAACTALDISTRQLAQARKLADAAAVNIELLEADLDHFDALSIGSFELIHSTYALPFVTEPDRLLAAAAGRLRPGGRLVLTVGHPVFAGEWLEIEDEGCGMFVRNYFRPPSDVRFSDDGETMIQARFWPLGQIADWLLAAGLRLMRLAEPRPLPIPLLSMAEIRDRVPYYSDAWAALYPQLERVPVVAVFVADRPG